MISRALTFFFFWAVFSNSMLAQKEELQPKPQVQLISRVQKDKILLRWALDQPLAWKRSNVSGFILEKFLYTENGVKLSRPKLLWKKPLRAAPLDTWRSIVEENNYAAIIAQALYGESFEVGGTEGTLADIVNTAAELEQRFSFSLLAADMNFEAAKKAAWGYVDTEVKANNKYVYRIRSAVAQEKMHIESSAVLVSLKDYRALPAPIHFQAIFGDKHAMLMWEYDMFKSIYTSYRIERSEDGTNFMPLSKEPLVNLNDKPDNPAKRMFYIDSLAKNDKTYYYRVQGITPFAERGTFSDTISGVGKPSLPFTPRISDFRFTDQPNEAVLYWEFPKEGEAVTQKFQLQRADADAGPFRVVVDSIAPDQRQVRFSELETSNYFSITAVGKDPRQKKTSFTTLIQPIDSMPPNPPIGLKGTIDSLGVVRFQWKPNEEKDLLGYRVFRGFQEKEEPAQLTKEPQYGNQFIDSVTVKNLNSKVYYYVVAVDKRYNASGFSEVLVLEKPDFIPPTAAVFSNYHIVEAGIELHWIPSSEQGAKHIILREQLGEKTPPTVIFESQEITTVFVDQNVQTNNTYRYRIKAVDKAGLESAPSSPITVQMLDLKSPKLIKDFQAHLDRENHYIELFWRAKSAQIAEYTIYKQKKDQPLSTWRILPSNSNSVVDQHLTPNEVYIYHIRATQTNGKYSNIKKIEVKF
ncbi:MAG: hypothetical protein OIF50_09795 [Flavobacteriaceae bacterium]|nr:hypothetical protein [Flavobacteriaceae bacterium]